MRSINILSSPGFSTNALAIVTCGTSRASDPTADEDNEHDDKIKSTTRAEVKHEKCSHALELRSKSEALGRVVKMKSKSKTQ